MSETMQSTDALVANYTAARHSHALAGKNGDIENAVEFGNEANSIEDKLQSRGVSKDKLRAFWSNYAETHGLDH
jgi:hypothetical protein